MSEKSDLILAVLAGLLIGAIFFGGLWWTIQKGFSSPHPAIWFTGSLLLRTAITVTGFYFISRGDWRRLVASLLGFILARMIVMRLTRALGEKKSQLVEEGAP